MLVVCVDVGQVDLKCLMAFFFQTHVYMSKTIDITDADHWRLTFPVGLFFF